MSIHRFNVQVAQAYGVNEAIILENISFWQAKNEANNHNFNDGRYWVYNSIKAFDKLFPYWSKGQITRLLKNLEDAEALVSGNYNKISYDRTKWYSLKREIHLLISGNGFVDFGKPIPDSNPDSNPDIKNIQKDFAIFWEAYPKKVMKGNAESTFIKFAKTVNLETLLEGIKNSSQLHREDKQYMPNAQAWLNGKGWLDEKTKTYKDLEHLENIDVYIDRDKQIVFDANGNVSNKYEFEDNRVTMI